MTNSKQLAGLIGPALIALSATEAGNMDVFANPIASVVYLNGAILFVAGLALVRAHNIWTWNWPIILTLTGWGALFGGLWRMAAPNAPQATDNLYTFAGLVAIASSGIILCIKAYGPRASSAEKPSDV